MNSLQRLTSATLLVTASIMAACRHKAEPQPEPTPVTTAAAPQPEPAPALPPSTPDAATPQPSSSGDEAATARARALLATPVYFAFDRFDLDAESRATLDAKIEVLRADRALRIRVEGHTDDRGSDEYNLALAQRRATSVQRYLAQHDVSADRVDIVSLGEERPTCANANESCWRANRRAEFVVIAP